MAKCNASSPTLPSYPVSKYFKPGVLDGAEDAVPGVEAVIYLVGEGRAVCRRVPITKIWVDDMIQYYISRGRTRYRPFFVCRKIRPRDRMTGRAGATGINFATL